ncbi:hypothetical protein TWF106_006285 [Orbilia oligospora]|uniref:Uncharacterized protein n=1 Tax=Orbilia oligospora TaxID=2813651 RepID=A0A7C8V442_ORBOL|nr:hypothetical protein TWF106_006285 [Orbilia oligospora]
MHVQVLLVSSLPLLVFSIPTSLPYLRFDNFKNFLDDLSTLQNEIQAQKIRPDLTDNEIQKLINQAKTAEVAAQDKTNGEVPPFGLVSKAVKYFDFVRKVTKDFPPVVNILEENDIYGPGDTEEIIKTAVEEEKQAEALAEQFEDDLDLYGTPPTNGEIIADDDDDDDDEFYTAISDPGFDVPVRYAADRVAGGGIPGIGARVWGDERPARRVEPEIYEEEKQRDPRLGGVVRNLYEEEFKEEEMNQDSDDSADLEGLRWYQNFLGPEDGFFDDPDAPAGV